MIEKSGVKHKGALRTPLSTADVFWRDRNTFGEGDDLDNSEVSRETALPSPSPPPPSAEPGMDEVASNSKAGVGRNNSLVGVGASFRTALLHQQPSQVEV